MSVQCCQKDFEIDVFPSNNPPAPSAYFRLEGFVANQLVDDIAGRNFTKGTLSGTFSPGKSGNGWSGTDTSDCPFTGDTFYDINTVATGFTLRMWIRKDGATALDWEYPIRTDNGFGGFGINVWNDGTVHFLLRNNLGVMVDANLPLPSFGVLHHVMCYWDKVGGKIGIKINDSPAVETAFGTVNATPGVTKRLGRISSTVPGQFDEVAFWKDVLLTPTQMTADYNSGTGLFWPWV